MEFFLEMLLTVVVALLLSFPVAKLVSVATPGNSRRGGGNDLTSDQTQNPEIGLGDDSVTEELRFGTKMVAPVLHSEMNFLVVDENVETVDRFGSEADRVDELQEAATGAESTAPVSPENVIAEEVIVRGQDERSDLTEEINGEIGAEREELMVQTTEAESTASVSPENVVADEMVIQGQEKRSETTEATSACVENEESGDVVVTESEEVRVEETNTMEENENTEEENEEKEELSIEEDDDWEGIERSELEKAFAAAAAKFLEESEKAEEIGAEAKMELYGLHKIATEGSCREAQPMAVMVSTRAKWNAWQKLGNMSQEEAMEQYLALISKEIPGFMNAGHTVGKMPEMETSVVLPPNSGSIEDPTTLDITGVESSKNVSGER